MSEKNTQEIDKPMYPTNWYIEERRAYGSVTPHFVVARKLSMWHIQFLNSKGNAVPRESCFRSYAAAEAALSKFLKNSSNVK